MLLSGVGHILLLSCFLSSIIFQAVPAYADAVSLPKPGVLLQQSRSFKPVLLKGLKIYPKDPFKFDFILDPGQSNVKPDSLQLEQETNKLIKYFLTAMTVPEKDLWVNLSPYEKDRMIAPNLGQTEMGKDMLAQDYILKQLTASLVYPESGLGKKFWDKVYARVKPSDRGVRIPVNMFNKVWIVADRADVYEHRGTAFIAAAHLKVMLEEDYVALNQHKENNVPDSAKVAGPLRVFREAVLPELEREINVGAHFVPLRQMFYSMILASWYKMALKESVLARIYGDQSKVKIGINQMDVRTNAAIYNRYLQAYKKGVFNYIKQDMDNGRQERAPRKYFAGGLNIFQGHAAQVIRRRAALSEGAVAGRFLKAEVKLSVVDQAMSDLGRKIDLAKVFEQVKIGDRVAVFAKPSYMASQLNDADGIIGKLDPVNRTITLYIDEEQGNVKHVTYYLDQGHPYSEQSAYEIEDMYFLKDKALISSDVTYAQRQRIRILSMNSKEENYDSVGMLLTHAGYKAQGALSAQDVLDRLKADGTLIDYVYVNEPYLGWTIGPGMSMEQFIQGLVDIRRTHELTFKVIFNPVHFREGEFSSQEWFLFGRAGLDKLSMIDNAVFNDNKAMAVDSIRTEGLVQYAAPFKSLRLLYGQPLVLRFRPVSGIGEVLIRGKFIAFDDQKTAIEVEARGEKVWYYFKQNADKKRRVLLQLWSYVDFGHGSAAMTARDGGIDFKSTQINRIKEGQNEGMVLDAAQLARLNAGRFDGVVFHVAVIEPIANIKQVLGAAP